jgi:hypothetical protein
MALGFPDTLYLSARSQENVRRIIMTKLWSLVLAIVVLLSLPSSALAKKKIKVKKSVVAADTVVVRAAVAAVDHSGRTITLKGVGGIPPRLRADESIGNLDQVRVGDKVVARYLEPVVVSLGKPQGISLASARNSEEMVARGMNPTRVAVPVVRIKAPVETINYSKRTMTIQGPEGGTLSLRIDKRIKELRSVRAGDEVPIHYTEPVILSLEKE